MYFDPLWPTRHICHICKEQCCAKLEISVAVPLGTHVCGFQTEAFVWTNPEILKRPHFLLFCCIIIPALQSHSMKQDPLLPGYIPHQPSLYITTTKTQHCAFLISSFLILLKFKVEIQNKTFLRVMLQLSGTLWENILWRALSNIKIPIWISKII